MADRWVLEVDGRFTESVRMATTRRSRARGLLRTDAGAALVLPRTRSVHTFAMAYDLDVALCTAAGEVRAILAMAPNQVSRPRRGVRTVVEAPAGTFGRWGLRVGDVVTFRPAT